MKASTETARASYIRSKLSWRRVVLWAALVTALLFAPIDWNGCGFFRYGAMDFVHFGCTFAWIVFFFALRMRWRLLLLAATVAVLFPYFGLHGIAEENAGPEAAAVGGLRQLQSGIEAHRREHQQTYPESLLAVPPPADVQKFYKYEYLPDRDTSGEIVSYVVQATPKRRDCDFYVSFTIADDGRVFYTYEARAARTSDELLQ